MDYRTYGKSKGALSEKAFYHDGQFCYNYLKERYIESEITIYGRSLGTGIATFVASKNEPKRLVLETPYYSLVDVAKKRFPLFPVTKLMQYKFPTYQFIKQVGCPILMLHGTTDKVVPLSSGKKLYDSFIHKDLTFIEIPNASHNNLIDFKEFNDAIKKHL